ncbi:MAG: cell division protein FtsL [Nitrospinaceae bacterium]|nr:cell division protein FtsL [Nitrospinaceae bacterium]MDP7057536.1 cell division protein FtsL [Nitrospinaceae bacterium]
MFKWRRKFIKTRFHVASREFRMVLVAVAGLMIGAMAFVWSNVRLVSLAYEHQSVNKVHKELLRENHLLRVERESLRSLDRIQSLAKNKIGLREPESGQIVTVFLKN